MEPYKRPIKKLERTIFEVAKDIEKLLETQIVNSQTVSIKTLTTELNQAIKLSKVFKQPAAMVAAIKIKAQLHGLLKEKREVDQTVKMEVKAVDLEERIKQIVGEELKDVLR